MREKTVGMNVTRLRDHVHGVDLTASVAPKRLAGATLPTVVTATSEESQPINVLQNQVIFLIIICPVVLVLINLDLSIIVLHESFIFKIVDGNWGQWGFWTTCSTLCGGGYQTRTRHCNDPIPFYGGANCSENAIYTESLDSAGIQQELENQSCNEQSCPGL